MRNKCERIVFSILFAVVAVFGLQSCGGDAQSEPAGLFEPPAADVSATLLPEGIVSGTQAVIGVAGTLSDLNPGIVTPKISMYKNIVPKAIALATKGIQSSECIQLDEKTFRCEFKYIDSDGTHVGLSAIYKFDNIGSQSANGTIRAAIQFIFSGSRDSCGRIIIIDGFMQCGLEFDFAITGEGVNYNFSGPCDTANDPDNVLDVLIDGELHYIGFDAVININQSDVEANGVVSIDTVSYPIEDLQNIVIGQCE